MTTADHYSYTTDLTTEDYQQFYAVLGRRQGSKRPGWIYLVALSCSIPVAVVLTYFTSYRPLNIGLNYVVAFWLGTLAMNTAIYVMHSGMISRISAIGTEDWKRFSVKVNDEGVAACGDGIMLKWQWPAVTDVTVEGEAVMVWFGRLQAVRIPDRAFADAAARDAVVALVRSRMTRRDG